MKDLTVLMAWHQEFDVGKVKAYEENKRTFEYYNPEIPLITVMSPFNKIKEAWLSTDLSIFHWYVQNKITHRSQRYLIVEWDCWCNCNLKEYYKTVWGYDIIVPGVKYPERDDWYWFKTIQHLPEKARKFATGIVPLCGILLSDDAMQSISEVILKDEYRGLNSELRLGTVATMLGFDPIVNPVCNRTISWRGISHFDQHYIGLHHPRKLLF